MARLLRLVGSLTTTAVALSLTTGRPRNRCGRGGQRHPVATTARSADQPAGPVVDRTFEIEFLGAGAEAYVFKSG
jgi:hypothetical protein